MTANIVLVHIFSFNADATNGSQCSAEVSAGDAVQKEVDAVIHKENSTGDGQHAVPVINVTGQAVRVEILVVQEITTPDTEEWKVQRHKVFCKHVCIKSSVHLRISQSGKQHKQCYTVADPEGVQGVRTNPCLLFLNLL